MTFKAGNYRTPATEMYERNHNLIPEIDVEEYELELSASKEAENENDEPFATLSFADLK